MAVRPVEPPDDAYHEMEPTPPSLQFVRQTCTIVRWRGYVTSEFHAVAADGTIFAASKAFRARGAKPPTEDEQTRAAYDSVVAELEATGWTLDGSGAEWYAARFGRDIAVPVEYVPEPPQELEPTPPPAPVATPRPVTPVRPMPPAPVAPPPVASPPPPVAPPPHPVEPPPPPVAPPPPPQLADDSTPWHEQPPPGREPRRSRRGRILALAALPAALGVLAYVVVGHDTSRAAHRSPAVRTPASAARPAHRATTHRAQPRTAKPAPVAPAPQPQPRLAKLDLVETGGSGSWLEARRGSADGPVLFSGTLVQGQALHLRGARIWVRFGGASNVSVTLNGRRLELQGTLDELFTSKRATPAP